MPHILAIEAVPARQARLTALVREYVHAELTIVDSVHDAVRALNALTPDVVLVPTLLSPQDERELMARLRTLPSPHVQTLTIPALELPDERARPRVRRSFLGRRRLAPVVPFDPQLAAARLAAGLERAHAAREERAWALALAPERTSVPYQGLPQAPAAPQDRAASAAAADERRRAPRIVPADVPWLSAVRMPWGMDVDLINISNTGLLLESPSRLSAGVTYEMQLQGPDNALIVKARIVRSDVGRVDQRGVRYQAAASFDRALDLLAGRGGDDPADLQQALARLLVEVVAETSGAREPADVRFARGLRRLLGARDVLVRSAPVPPADGSESIYFHVPAGERSRVLQVLFDPDRALTEAEFRLLKAAAPMTAAVIELDRGALLLPEPARVVA